MTLRDVCFNSGLCTCNYRYGYTKVHVDLKTNAYEIPDVCLYLFKLPVLASADNCCDYFYSAPLTALLQKKITNTVTIQKS